jgi:hypothetical protein
MLRSTAEAAPRPLSHRSGCVRERLLLDGAAASSASAGAASSSPMARPASIAPNSALWTTEAAEGSPEIIDVGKGQRGALATSQSGVRKVEERTLCQLGVPVDAVLLALLHDLLKLAHKRCRLILGQPLGHERREVLVGQERADVGVV